MKRHESIVTLSREHHFGLLFCWKIRQGIKKQVSAERIQPYIKYFWENHLQKHFEEEETLLFILMQDSLVEEAIAEHKHIRQLLAVSVTTEPIDSKQLNILVDTLDNHIRFEERVLFPHMEEKLSEEKLAELGSRLQNLHPIREKDDYPDEFWV